MKLLPFAVLVLVSLCAPQIPASDATVSGTAFWDLNVNGVRDRCDYSLTSRIVILHRGDGVRFEATSRGNGAFSFEHVEAGEYTLQLKAEGGKVWPLTTENPPIKLRGMEVVEGLAIGSAANSPLQDLPTVVGVVFEDPDGDGKPGEDECPIAGAGVVSDLGQSYQPPPNAPGTGTFKVPAGVSPGVTALLPPGEALRFQTTGGNDGVCNRRVAGELRWGRNIYSANIGFSYSGATGQVTGYIFEDRDGDGVRGAEESTLPGFVTLTPRCSHPDVAAEAHKGVGDDGSFTFDGLRPGRYTLRADAFIGGTPVEEGTEAPTMIVSTTADEIGLTVGRDPVAADIGFKRVRMARVIVAPFDDANGDGVRSPGEWPAWGVNICALDPARGSPLWSQVVACGEIDDGGVAELWTPPGRFSLASQLFDAAQEMQLVDAGVWFTVADGEEASLDLALTLPAELRVPFAPDVRSEINWTVCAEDPGWLQPPLDVFTGLGGFTLSPEDAAEVHARHAYRTFIGSPAYAAPTVVAAGLADVWPRAACAPSADESSTVKDPNVEQLTLLHYAPTAIYQSGESLEVHVLPRDSGWLTLRADYSLSPFKALRNVYVVNDETGEIRLACRQYGCKRSYGMTVGR